MSRITHSLPGSVRTADREGRGFGPDVLRRDVILSVRQVITLISG